MSVIKIDGELEIDTERGVIYFSSRETGHTTLRVCRLPTPIPDPSEYGNGLDVTHMHGASWGAREDSKEGLSPANHPFSATPNKGKCACCGKSRFNSIHKMHKMDKMAINT